MTVSFADDPHLTIIARCAVQLTRQAYKRHAHSRYNLSDYPLLAAADLPPEYHHMVRFALHSFAVWIGNKGKAKEWLSGIRERELSGAVFRAVFFAPYKAQRRAYPRVTNRGVQLRFDATLSNDEVSDPNA